jgi:predicted nucleotidyltransferase
MNYPPAIFDLVNEQPYPLVFATISGAHLYGFPSPDSDFDLRGVHILPAREIVGLDVDHESLEISGDRAGLEMDLVTHDAKKFFLLMLKKNGYVLEQLFSPLIVKTTPEHDELKQIGRDCVTRHHVHHYLGFAETQWKLFEKKSPRRIKPLLYVYRVLLTGIHLMRSGEIEANLVKLNEQYPLPYVPDLITRKLAGPERATLTETDFDFHRREYDRLIRSLREASERSSLPEVPTARAALNDLLIRLRGCK